MLHAQEGERKRGGKTKETHLSTSAETEIGREEEEKRGGEKSINGNSFFVL